MGQGELATVMARLDYGVGTNVQVTGGDPTMRDHDELERIILHLRDLKLVPSLFTNGDLASRELLQRLAEAGLCDVAGPCVHLPVLCDDPCVHLPVLCDDRACDAAGRSPYRGGHHPRDLRPAHAAGHAPVGGTPGRAL